MCGIAGLISLRHERVPALDRRLVAMSGLLGHRRPDGNGYWMRPNGPACLAHRRLAIIDRSPSGHQPMLGPSRTGITYNGEVYNSIELMEELHSHWRFRSRSDTEAILAAYDRWGDECLTRLRGMFAFAICDDRRLLAARDRFGIKPFYYAVIGDVLYFASEIKAL